MNTRPDSSPRAVHLIRLRGLVKKEFLQVIRDPSSIAIAFLLPLILLLIFGYGISLDPKHVPIAIVMEDPGPEALSIAGAFQASQYFTPVLLTNVADARRRLTFHEVEAILYMRNNFASTLVSPHKSDIQLLLNGVDSNYARVVQGYVEGLLANWTHLQALAREGPPPAGLRLQQRIWFNSEVRSTNFLVPGLIAVIMTLIGALLTALVVAREWERGTMESLLATPITASEMLLGKTIPYFVLGMGGLVLSVVVGVFLFDVPLRGSIVVLLGVSALFLLTALGMGLLISSLTRNQFVASQIAILATFLPAFMLSGFIFDISSTPTVVQWLTRIIPARYFVSSLQTVFLAGNVHRIFLFDSVVLIAMAAFLLLLTRRVTRKTLD